MYSASSVSSFHTVLSDFQLKGMTMRYSTFMPRLYNYCLSLGMEPEKIMPSRAFCADESQGFPIILITKHFGTFPFNHGLVGGVVATDLHGPHAAHGKDMVIIQASHVGYDPETEEFGTYRRIQSEDTHNSTNCGKIAGILDWFENEYAFARDNIVLEPGCSPCEISINNLLLHTERDEGLFPDLDHLIARDDKGSLKLIRSLSTARTFAAATELIEQIGDHWPQDRRRPIGDLLTPDLFHFKRNLAADAHLERNLIEPMPWIITDAAPALAAAQINTQVEFDRAYRTILQEKSYQNRNLLFIAGLNIDISPKEDQSFPLTKFVPWAAYVQSADGAHTILEQQELFDLLMECSTENPHQIDLEAAIADMEHSPRIDISSDPGK